MTGRKLTIHINKQIAKYRQERNIKEINFWQTMCFMHKRPSMKRWTLAQLIAQYDKTNKEHNIIFETLNV